MKTAVHVVALTFMLLAVAAHAQWPLGRDMMPQPKIEPGPTVTVTGRFQIFTSPYLKGDTFMLDTQSGRVWILEKDSTSGEFSMKRVRVEEVDAGRKASTEDKKSDKNGESRKVE